MASDMPMKPQDMPAHPGKKPGMPMKPTTMPMHSPKQKPSKK